MIEIWRERKKEGRKQLKLTWSTVACSTKIVIIIIIIGLIINNNNLISLPEFNLPFIGSFI